MKRLLLVVLAAGNLAVWAAQAGARVDSIPTARGAGGRSQTKVLLAQAEKTSREAPKDYAEALKWFQKAAQKGHKNAQYMLGLLHYNGTGIKQSYADAREWFQKAASQDHGEAQYMLGLMYYEGKGVPKNHDKAAQWFRKAAEKGDKDAQYMLGLIYYDRAKAKKP